MLKMRVFRVNIPMTLFGLEIWAFMTVGFGSLFAMQFYQSVMPVWQSVFFSLATGFGLMKLVEVIKHFFPGRALQHQVMWIGQGDRYTLEREKKALPLLLIPDDRPAAKRQTGTAPAKPPHKTRLKRMT